MYKLLNLMSGGKIKHIAKMNQRKYKVKTEELKKGEVYLADNLVDIEASQSVTKVTEEDIRGLLTGFKEYVVTKNSPECKIFIQDFVKEVVVFKTHVEVVFNVGFNFIKDIYVDIKSIIPRMKLFLVL